MRAFIPDGYTLTGKARDTSKKTTAENPDADVAFTYEYRPMLGAMRRRLTQGTVSLQQAGLEGMELAAKAYVDAMVKHLVSWSLTDADKPVPLTAENLARLDGWAFEQIVDSVCGWGGREEAASAKN